MPHLLAAEVSGGLGAGAAVHGDVGVATVVVTVAGGGLTLIHGVILGRPLQRREALGMPAERRAVIYKKNEDGRRRGDASPVEDKTFKASLIFVNLG